MTDYLTEDEQVELLKSYWNQYGNLAVSIILFAMLLLLSYNWFTSHSMAEHRQASQLFQNMLLSELRQDTDGIKANANSLIEQFPKMNYASFARMQLAKVYAQRNKFDLALSYYNQVLKLSNDPALKQLTTLRMARIYKAQKNYEKALALLTPTATAFYPVLRDDLKGDIYALQHDFKKASEAYKSALAKTNNKSAHAQVLEMKLNNLS